MTIEAQVEVLNLDWRGLSRKDMMVKTVCERWERVS